MTQQETFPKQGCVESLTACGLGRISLAGAPLAPSLLLGRERLLLSPVCPRTRRLVVTSASPPAHGELPGQTWGSPDPSPVTCDPGTPWRGPRRSQARLAPGAALVPAAGNMGPRCRLPCPSLMRAGALLGCEETLIRPVPFPALSDTAPA